VKQRRQFQNKHVHALKNNAQETGSNDIYVSQSDLIRYLCAIPECPIWQIYQINSSKFQICNLPSRKFHFGTRRLESSSFV